MSNTSRLSLGALWLVVPTVLVFIDVASLCEYQGDLWTHLRQGRLIAETGAIPKTDQITYTIYGQPVLNQNWFGQLVLYYVHTIDGIRSTNFFAAVLYAVMIALVTWVCYARSGDARCAAAGAVIAAACAWTNLSVRTQTFGILCFTISATLMWLWPRGKWWPLAIVALNQLFWTNVHGTFPLGVVLPGVFAVGRALEATKDGWKAALADDLVQKHLLAAVVALAVSFVNPAPELTLGYLDQNVSRSTGRGVMEWAAPSLNELSGRIFFASVVVAMIALNFSGRRLGWLELVVLVVFFLLGAKAVRMIVWWGLMIAPVLAVQFAAWKSRLETERAAARAADPSSPAEEESESPFMNWLVAGVLAASVVFSTPWTKHLNPLLTPARKLEVFVDEPRAAVQTLIDRKATGNIFSSLEWGAYISWHLPHAFIVLDARIDQFSDQLWGEVATVSGGIAGWEELLKRDRVNWIVFPTTAGKNLIAAVRQSPNWREVQSDATATVFERIEHLPDVHPSELAKQRAAGETKPAAAPAANSESTGGATADATAPR